MKKNPNFLRNIDNLEIKNDLKIIRDSSVFGFSLFLYFVVMKTVKSLVTYIGFNMKEVYIAIFVACTITAIILYYCVKRSKLYRTRNLKFVIRNVNIVKLLSIYSLDLMFNMCCLSSFFIIQLTILNKIGISILEPSSDNMLESNPLTYIIVSAILGPISEELICRGIGVGILKKYGRTTAIFLVSMIFGLCHGNIAQSICAMISGIALSYVYLEYGLVYSIFLHMLNNFLVDMIFISNSKSVIIVLISITTITGIITLYKKGYSIIKYLRNNSFKIKVLILEILSPFIIILIMMSISSIVENIKII